VEINTKNDDQEYIETAEDKVPDILFICLVIHVFNLKD